MGVLTTTSVCWALALAGGEPEVRWGETKLSMKSLPPELPASARRAIESWIDWAGKLEYRLDLDPTGRVLLVSRAASGKVPGQLELVGSVIASVDRELPAPAVRRTVAPLPLASDEPGPKTPAAGGRAPLQDDPEEAEGAHPWKLTPRKAQEPVRTVTTTSWGALDVPFDTETAVMLVVKDEKHFRVLLDNLGRVFPHLAEWAESAKSLQGFVLGHPLVGAYLEDHPSLEEWNPDHELVSRLGRLFLLRRFGELPNWFVQGYAWHLEISIQGAVYCFPWRDEFVYAVEHTDWPRMVRNRYEEEKRVKTEDFLGWRRGRYVGEKARTSWGMVEYLLAREGPKLPDLLDELRVFREENGRIQDGPSSWRRDVDYEIPLADQQRILVERLGAAYLDGALEFLREIPN